MKKLSEILRERRIESGYTLERIEKETKIKKEFIAAIEEGRYKDLPSDSYAMGFVKNYARFLGIPESKAMALFRRDYKTGKSEFVPHYRKKKYTQARGFTFSVKGVLFLLAGIIIIAYLGFQISAVFVGPKLIVSTPNQGEKVNKKLLDVAGDTDPYATLEINGEEAYVGMDGSFKKSIFVFEGEQKITIVAKNRFGKTTAEEIVIQVAEPVE